MIVQQWGTIEFRDAWRRQRELVDAILHQDHPDTLVLCEHPSVITLGRNTQQGSVLTQRELLGLRNIDVIEIDRGGEATVHNPGQLVGYPIFNLQRTKPDLHWFLRTVEQSIIDALRSFEIESGRVDGLTGVWIDSQRKICAIGIHCSRWVTSHGFALNVCNDLSLFSEIVPCGITDRGVTSLQREINPCPPLDEVVKAVSNSFTNNFQ
ncbi:MAG: lipoyl(octanoyl) transferase LipB [Candidatus Kapabacteria bacterium]|nr:lipoyl(octanoyl) transferase LipB [Candidatus Kapabacteria bacterium]